MKRITKIEENMLLEKRKLRVAAYCRVSTDSEEQITSYEAQKLLHPEDRGKSGLGTGRHLCRQGAFRHQHEKAGQL